MTSLNSWSAIDGTTGVSYAAASDGVTRYEVNDNNNRWVGLKVTTYTAGNVAVYVDMSDNQ